MCGVWGDEIGECVFEDVVVRCGVAVRRVRRRRGEGRRGARRCGVGEIVGIGEG